MRLVRKGKTQPPDAVTDFVEHASGPVRSCDVADAEAAADAATTAALTIVMSNTGVKKGASRVAELFVAQQGGAAVHLVSRSMRLRDSVASAGLAPSSESSPGGASAASSVKTLPVISRPKCSPFHATSAFPPAATFPMPPRAASSPPESARRHCSLSIASTHSTAQQQPTPLREIAPSAASRTPLHPQGHLLMDDILPHQDDAWAPSWNSPVGWLVVDVAPHQQQLTQQTHRARRQTISASTRTMRAARQSPMDASGAMRGSRSRDSRRSLPLPGYPRPQPLPAWN